MIWVKLFPLPSEETQCHIKMVPETVLSAQRRLLLFGESNHIGINDFVSVGKRCERFKIYINKYWPWMLPAAFCIFSHCRVLIKALFFIDVSECEDDLTLII